MIQFRSQFAKNNDAQNQLEMFDVKTMNTMTQEPVLGKDEKWNRFELLNKEKEVLGVYLSGHPLDDFSIEVKNFCTHQIRDIDLFQNPINNFTFSGYVQSNIERMSKNNKPYGVLTLEDYSCSKEIRLFGDNYIKFRNYFIQGALLYFSASMVNRSWDGNLVMKINNVSLLSDVSSKMMREINFSIQLADINDQFIESLMAVIQKYPGKHNLKLSVSTDQTVVNFLSKKYQVAICKELINEMNVFSKEFSLQ